MEANKTPQFSIVIPAYNEAESLPVLFQRIQIVIKTHDYTAEVIFVNDGSTDGTDEVLEQLALEQVSDNLQVHVIHFRRNQGKAEGLMAGFSAARGKIVITMDADLQDDPQEIPKLLDALEKGNADLISGWKYPRKDPLEKRMFSFVFNRVTAFFTGVKLHDMNCGFKIYRSEVVKTLHLYGDLHRYIPILANAAGFSVAEVKVKHHPRQFGVSKYGFKRIPKGFFDLITVLFLTKYKKRPMHFFAGLGSLFTFGGIVVFIGIAVLHFFPTIQFPMTPLWFSGGFCIVLGIILCATGLLGELLVSFFARGDKR
ncbi:MAG: glycosyltransferase family 2 protein [Candidatus Poribacteria bacterium]|nr:glycosyltransferase family 2 protein [Candidatus Poribacteria bacterium]